MKPQKIAAIDIGSNSIKLAVVETVAPPAAAGQFAVLYQQRERVRLGEETLRRKFLSPEAVRRSVDAVAVFRSIADQLRAETILAVATASVREAENAADLTRAVRAETGVEVEVLSETEEARLIGVAAARNCGLKEGSLLNVDIGGGSTELSLMRADGVARRLFSMKIGAVGLTRKFLFSDPPRREELDSLLGEINAALGGPARELLAEKWQLASGTSGTILNFASLLNRRKTLGGGGGKSAIRFERLAALNETLARITTRERARLPRLSPQRAEVLVAGGQILEAVMRALKIQTLRPCPFALREGVIIDHLQKTAGGSEAAADAAGEGGTNLE